MKIYKIRWCNLLSSASSYLKVIIVSLNNIGISKRSPHTPLHRIPLPAQAFPPPHPTNHTTITPHTLIFFDSFKQTFFKFQFKSYMLTPSQLKESWISKKVALKTYPSHNKIKYLPCSYFFQNFQKNSKNEWKCTFRSKCERKSTMHFERKSTVCSERKRTECPTLPIQQGVWKTTYDSCSKDAAPSGRRVFFKEHCQSPGRPLKKWCGK